MKKFHAENALSTSELCKILGANCSVKFLTSCGISPLVSTGVGVYWRASDVPLIGSAVGDAIKAAGRAYATEQKP